MHSTGAASHLRLTCWILFRTVHACFTVHATACLKFEALVHLTLAPLGPPPWGRAHDQAFHNCLPEVYTDAFQLSMDSLLIASLSLV